MELTDNLNIKDFKPLITPKQLKEEFPETEEAAQFVAESRNIIQAILTNRDDRRIVLAGPCSLHDCKGTLEYGERLRELQDEVKDKILIIMRAYFEKPRTTVGWKGMIYDPRLDNSYDIEEGLRQGRRLLLGVAKMGLPCATEFLDPIVPQYLADFVSWAAIGARTTESQIHRQMASGLSMPVGFKNSTGGSLQIALDALKSTIHPHSFIGIDHEGQTCILSTTGNKAVHLIMRGGSSGPNYYEENVEEAEELFGQMGIEPVIMIDVASSANSPRRRIGGPCW